MQTVPSQPRRIPVRKLRVEIAGGDRFAVGDSITVGTAANNDLVLTDPKVSRYHLSLRATGRDIVVTDLGSTNGTRIGPVCLLDGSARIDVDAVISIGDTRLRVRDGGFEMVDVSRTDSVGGILGRSPAMQELRTRVEQAAASDTPVLILGESGTGKELIARALHDLSARAEAPMVTLDAAALTPTLYASELFGHERGAFTGALHRHIGAFERAHRGTLFLDEVGELTEPMQGALLGAVERQRIRRVGGQSDIAFDARLVCATHRDLRGRVNDGRFRLDLYYRLAIIVIEVPALREHAEDIEVLIDHFIARAGGGTTARVLFGEEGLHQLTLHSWPGNVRELRNVVLRTLAVGHAEELPNTPGQPREIGPEHSAALLSRPFKEARRSTIDNFEATYLERLLERNGGNVRKSSRDAQIDRSYLIQLLRKHGLKP